MKTMDTHIHASTHGTILYDATVAPQVEHAWFDPEHWHAQGQLERRGGGRGAVSYLATPVGRCVLRHYHRGGMVANVLGDRYLWTGRMHTRSFAEFRLLESMREAGLPVPEPIAARYVRRGVHYTADLITRCIDDARTLADCLAAEALDAALAGRCGVLIARFHQAGIWHADLNAHNVLISADTLYLIDFDRGERRKPARGWQQANLRRLRRSLVKLGAAAGGEDAFDKTLWLPLMHGYAAAMERASA